MRHWIGVVSTEQFETERLYAREVITVADGVGAGTAAEIGDPVVLATGGTRPVLFGHGVVREWVGDQVIVSYQGRLFDDSSPLPSDVLPAPAAEGLFPLPASQHTRLATLVSASAEAGAGRSVWFVSVALPIEATSRGEAVREFWTYVDKLGPRELPAYVWPLGDELAMQAFVLGAVTDLDPEQESDDDGTD